jgi:hypothetical protein
VELIAYVDARTVDPHSEETPLKPMAVSDEDLKDGSKL